MRFVSLLLSVMGPVALWAAVYASVMAYRDDEAAMADDNAGRVLNARVVSGDVTQTIDRLLAVRDPQVIVMGPSYANTNVRPKVLAEHLGLDPQRIVLISVPNSVGAHWYAILQYRVIAAGYRPKLVLFVSGLRSMLLTTPLTEASFVNLRVQLPERGDPTIDAKVRGSANLWWARVREQRGKVRGAFFDGIRDHAVFWEPPFRTRRALARVFDDAHIDMALYDHAMPVVQSNARTERGFTPDVLPTPEESFLGDITALASHNGIRAVWVRPPMSPHIPAEHDDVVPSGFQVRAVGVVESRGGTYVDLRTVPMTAAMFRNEDHMNHEGSRRFSGVLAQVVRDRGWLDGVLPSLVAATGEELGSGVTLLRRDAPASSTRREARLGLAAGVSLTTPRPVGRVPRSKRPVIDQRGRVAAYDTSTIGFLSDEALRGAVSWSEPCSPLRITEDGQQLAHPNAPCSAVRNQGEGRSCHTREALFFTASDGTDPASNGRSYELVLAEDRTCGGEVFLYPEDLLRFTVSPEALSGLAGGPRTLVIDARYLQHRAAAVRVRVSLGDAVVLDRAVTSGALREGPVVLALAAVDAMEGPATVELENLDRNFYLVRQLSLTGAPDQ